MKDRVAYILNSDMSDKKNNKSPHRRAARSDGL